MAKATKTTTKTTTAKASAPAAATTTTRRPGSNPAKDAAQAATATGQPAYDAKANAAKSAAESKANATEARFVVAPGKSIRKGGVRYTGGEAIDLSPADQARFLESGHVLEDDGGETAQGAGGAPVVEDGNVPLAPGDRAPTATLDPTDPSNPPDAAAAGTPGTAGADANPQ